MPRNQPTHFKVRSISPPRPRWPPPPTVEDEVIALAKESGSEDTPLSQHAADAEVSARGAVDQQPVILEVPPSATRMNQTHDISSGRSSVRTRSSSDSLGPGTPVNIPDANYDRRYIHIPQEGPEIPISYGDIHESERPSSVLRKTHALDRDDTTPLKINIDDTLGRAPSASPRRDPSPYAFIPSSNKGRYSGDHFLSPDVMYSSAWNQDGPRVRDTVRQDRSRSAEPRSQEICPSRQGGRSSSGPAPTRPLAVRHQSAMADPGSRVRAEQSEEVSDLESSSDESDFEAYGQKNCAPANPAETTRPSAHTPSNSYHGGQFRIPMNDPIRSPKRHTWSPPRRPPPAYDNRTPLTTVSSRSGFSPKTALGLDAYFASSLLKQKIEPDGASTLTLPFPSPPRSPRTEAVKTSRHSFPTAASHRPTPRPVSPLSVHPPPQHLSPRESNLSTQNDPRWGGYGLSHSSPLPSPEIKEFVAMPRPRIEVQTAPSASDARSYSHSGDGYSRSSSRQPSPTPLSTLRSASRPPSRGSDQRSSSYVESTQHVPPVARSSNLSPSLPPRSRPTTPQSSGDVVSTNPPLPACPRPGFVSGYNDWYTFGGRPNFDICPPCMQNAIGAEYQAWFARAPPKPPGITTKCDFSSPWVRIAWLKTLNEKKQNPEYLHAVASIDEEQCPGRWEREEFGIAYPIRTRGNRCPILTSVPIV